MDVMQELRETFEMLQSCCLHDPQWTLDDVEEILATAVYDYSGPVQTAEEASSLTGSECESMVIVKLKDSKFGLLESSEDYTGHGCQCGSFAGKYETLDDVFRLGMPEYRDEMNTFMRGQLQ